MTWNTLHIWIQVNLLADTIHFWFKHVKECKLAFAHLPWPLCFWSSPSWFFLFSRLLLRSVSRPEMCVPDWSFLGEVLGEVIGAKCSCLWDRIYCFILPFRCSFTPGCFKAIELDALYNSCYGEPNSTIPIR